MKQKLDLTWVRRLHPIKEGKRKYRFLTIGFLRVKLEGELANLNSVKLIDQNGAIRAIIKKGYITIYPNYAWNGCSPKNYVGWPPFGKWVGTPDFEATIRASLVHDILYQYAFLLPIKFEDVNFQFYSIMKEDGFCLAKIYYKAVQEFGKDFWGVVEPGLKVQTLNNSTTLLD